MAQVRLTTERIATGEQYRKLADVSVEDSLMMCGIFKQATMGDCLVEGKFGYFKPPSRRD